MSALFVSACLGCMLLSATGALAQPPTQVSSTECLASGCLQEVHVEKLEEVEAETMMVELLQTHLAHPSLQRAVDQALARDSAGTQQLSEPVVAGSATSETQMLSPSQQLAQAAQTANSTLMAGSTGTHQQKLAQAPQNGTRAAVLTSKATPESRPSAELAEASAQPSPQQFVQAAQNGTSAIGMTPDASLRSGSSEVIAVAMDGSALGSKTREVGQSEGDERRATWTPRDCTGAFCFEGCSLGSLPTKDGGCCLAGSIGTGKQGCAQISCSSILKYACGISTAKQPTCQNNARWFSNKDDLEECALEGHSCTYTKYGYWTRLIDINDKRDMLKSDCEDVPTYRRHGDGPWTQS